MTNSSLLKMAIEMVDLAIKDVDFSSIIILNCLRVNWGLYVILNSPLTHRESVMNKVEWHGIDEVQHPKIVFFCFLPVPILTHWQWHTLNSFFAVFWRVHRYRKSSSIQYHIHYLASKTGRTVSNCNHEVFYITRFNHSPLTSPHHSLTINRWSLSAYLHVLSRPSTGGGTQERKPGRSWSCLSRTRHQKMPNGHSRNGKRFT